eukprot:5107132-Prymnesium_polylepis.1
MCLRRRHRVTPKTGCQLERRHRTVHTTPHTAEGATRQALGCWGIGMPAVVAGIADAAKCRAQLRALAPIAPFA